MDVKGLGKPHVVNHIMNTVQYSPGEACLGCWIYFTGVPHSVSFHLCPQCLRTFVESHLVPFPVPCLGSMVGGSSVCGGAPGTLDTYWVVTAKASRMALDTAVLLETFLGMVEALKLWVGTPGFLERPTRGQELGALCC